MIFQTPADARMITARLAEKPAAAQFAVWNVGNGTCDVAYETSRPTTLRLFARSTGASATLDGGSCGSASPSSQVVGWADGRGRMKGRQAGPS